MNALAQHLPKLPRSAHAWTTVFLWMLLAGILAGCQSNPRRIVPYQGEQDFPLRSAPVARPPEQIARPPILEAGYASFYGEELRGELMANGQPFDPDQLIAASWFYPFGTRIRVFHRDRSVVVTITDRGPAKRLVRQGRIIDLSRAAFEALANPHLGLIPVRIQRADDGN